MALQSLINRLSLIDDPRSEKKTALSTASYSLLYQHLQVRFLVYYAGLSEVYEQIIRELYKHLLGFELEYMTPRNNTLNRIPQAILHETFKRAYLDWISTLLHWDEATRQICIDGDHAWS